jgi:hypothetical protein
LQVVARLVEEHDGAAFLHGDGEGEEGEDNAGDDAQDADGGFESLWGGC